MRLGKSPVQSWDLEADDCFLKLWALEFMSFPAQNGSRFQWIEVGCTSFGDIPGGYVGPSNFPEFFFR